MNCINHHFLKYNPDTVEYIRKIYNLHQPGRLTEAIRILDEWTKKQNHFTKKEFDPYFLETTLIACKGSMEKSKKQLDKICTFRTLMPEYFTKYHVRKDAGNLYDFVKPVILPKMTSDNYRVLFIKLCDGPFTASQYMDYYKYCISLAEYLRAHDYLNGFLTFADFRDMNVLDFVTKLNPVVLRQAITIFIEGFGMRLKGIHILSTSKFIDGLVTILKQVLSEKLSKRISMHRDLDSVFESIPKSVLPADYGGEEKELKELLDIWLDLLSSKEHLDYLDRQREVKTDESLRKAMTFNEEYAGMPGTFRALCVD